MTPANPYWSDGQVTLYLGDCREIMSQFAADAASLVLTDPPYGIGKADWDGEFQSWWLPEAARIAPALGLMPGAWNLPGCPEHVGRLRYRWTLAAHLVNGMTRGAIGYANWIPCLVYGADSAPDWCQAFASWCDEQSISRGDLNRAAGTSDMGGWWTSRLPHRAAIPAPDQWSKIRAAFSPPERFDIGVNTAARLYRKASDAQRIVVGRDDKPDHPSPKPISAMRWFVGRLAFPGDLVLDPFAGSGSTLIAAREQGCRAIGIEIDERYCELAARRLAQGDLFGSAA